MRCTCIFTYLYARLYNILHIYLRFRCGDIRYSDHNTWCRASLDYTYVWGVCCRDVLLHDMTYPIECRFSQQLTNRSVTLCTQFCEQACALTCEGKKCISSASPLRSRRRRVRSFPESNICTHAVKVIYT